MDDQYNQILDEYCIKKILPNMDDQYNPCNFGCVAITLKNINPKMDDQYNPANFGWVAIMLFQKWMIGAI